METLNAGMYVRTKFGISKIIEDGNVKIIKSDNEETYDVDKNGRHYPTQFRDYIWTSDVIKASHNIIDLIEVGDFITLGENCYPLQVMNIWEFAGELNIELSNKAKFEDIKSDSNFKIYSIVTKEQFEEMKYVIE